MNMTVDTETRELDDFRAEARAWIVKNYPESLKDKLEEYYQLQPRYPEGADWKLWKDRVVAKTWGTPGWPKEIGGGGLSTVKARSSRRWQVRRLQSDRRHGRVDVRPDPARIRHRGAEAAFTCAHRRAARCAGARATPSRAPAPTSPRLQTKAEDKGDHYLVNGQKIWTPAPSTPTGASAWCAPTPAQEARGHQLPADRHEDAGRRGAADPADHRHLAVLRDVLHRREGAEGATWSAQLNGGWTIAKRAAAVTSAPTCRAAAAWPATPATPRRAWPRSMSASTTRGASPTRNCARASPST